MINKLNKFTNALATNLDYVAGAAVVGMMLVTIMDIALRLLRISQPGAYELVEMLGGAAVAFAMAHTTLNKGHVAVSIIIQKFPKRLQRILDSVTSLLGCALFGLASWFIFLIGLDYKTSGQTSMTLEIPMHPVAYAMAFSLAAVSLSLFLLFLRNIIKAAD